MKKQIMILLSLLFVFSSLLVAEPLLSENFDSSTEVPTGWTVLNEDGDVDTAGDPYQWKVVADGTTQTSYSAPNCIKVRFNADGNDDYLLPPN